MTDHSDDIKSTQKTVEYWSGGKVKTLKFRVGTILCWCSFFAMLFIIPVGMLYTGKYFHPIYRGVVGEFLISVASIGVILGFLSAILGRILGAFLAIIQLFAAFIYLTTVF